MDDEERRKRRMLSQIQNRIWSHTVTIRVSKVVGSEESSWNTASGILIGIGSRRFVATAWHVIAKLVELRNEGELAVLVIGNAATTNPQYVFIDERNDLVVLDVTHEPTGTLNALPYFPSRQWPPPRVTVGEFILICGFPAILRTDGDEIEHGDFSFFGEVESVSEFQFIVQAQGEIEDVGRIPFSTADADLGGLSGSPAFVLYPDHMQLVGIFSQSAESAPVWIIRSLAHLPLDIGGSSPTPV